MGRVDFRENTGRSEIERRPRAGWWAELISDRQTIKVSPAGEDQSFKKWWEWLRTAVAPRILELAQSVHRQPADIFDWLTTGVEPGNNAGPIVEQFKLAYLQLQPTRRQQPSK